MSVGKKGVKMKAGADGHRAPVPGETGRRVVLLPGAELTRGTFIPRQELPPSVASDPPFAQPGH